MGLKQFGGRIKCQMPVLPLHINSVTNFNNSQLIGLHWNNVRTSGFNGAQIETLGTKERRVAYFRGQKV